MSGLYGWVRSMVFYLILMTMILNLLPDKKYEKYLRLYTGTVFILLVFGPFADLTGLEERVAGAFERITFQNDVRLLREELDGADEKRAEKMLSGYREAVELDTAAMAESAGLRCLDARAELNGDPGNENFGALEKLELDLAPDGTGAGNDRELRIAANRRIAELKTKIGEYYGLEEGKITIRLETE